MNRMTHERRNGIKTGYWSPNTKEELVQRLAAYENTGLEPQQIKDLASVSAQSKKAESAWISVEDELPPIGHRVIVFREYEWGEVRVEQGIRDIDGWWRVYGTRTKKVSHWMPLPAPPEGQDHDQD